MSGDIHVAIIGAGRHGRDLINWCMDIPGVRFQAACDIWSYAQKYAAGLLKKRGHAAAVYEDYRDMLAKEKGLDAAIIATPDSFHADQAIACLESGLHVYCEKEMHTTIDGARRMVKASRDRKKLLQIGRQHRSNPRYTLARQYIYEKKALGRITSVFGQWHGHKRVPYTWPAAYAIDAATLKRYGFASMEEHRNWRWLEKFSAGEIANLGSHQIDVFNWFLGSPPKAVMATGGLDYYNIFELYDNAECLFAWDFAWEGKTRTVRGTYNVQTTTDDGGFHEVFTGDQGSMGTSEDTTKGGIFREEEASPAECERDLTSLGIRYSGYYASPTGYMAWALFRYGMRPPPLPPNVYVSGRQLRIYEFPSVAGDDKPPHWHHLKNFFDAARGQGKLNCPGEVGFQACVSALKAIEAMKAGRRLELKPDDFAI